MSSTLLLPPRAQLCNRSCSNKTHTPIRLVLFQARHRKTLMSRAVQSPSPQRSLVRDGQISPYRPRLVVSRSTCPPLSPPTQSSVVESEFAARPERTDQIVTMACSKTTLSSCIVSPAESRQLPCPPPDAPTALYAPGIWECWRFFLTDFGMVRRPSVPAST